MKKLIGILSICVFAATLFFADNSVDQKPNGDLASLLSIATANAEDGIQGCRYSNLNNDYCLYNGLRKPGCANNYLANNCW